MFGTTGVVGGCGMDKRALISANNFEHNVPALLRDASGSLRALARVYFLTHVAGQAKATVEAKHRDLARFIGFYEALYNHDHPDEWYTSVTRYLL